MNTTNKDFKHIWQNITTNYSHWLSFVLLMIVAVVINPSFLSFTNLTNQFVQGAIVGICAMGMSLVISAGMIDLSVGSSVALVSGLGILLLNRTQSIVLCLLFCLGFGLLLGLFNGLFITKGNIAPFIVTLATFSAYRSIITQLGQGGPFTVDKSMYDAFRSVAAGKIFGIPHLMIIFILITLLTGFIMSKTKFGRYVYAVGSNQQAARLAGIKVGNVRLLSTHMQEFCMDWQRFFWQAVLLPFRRPAQATDMKWMPSLPLQSAEHRWRAAAARLSERF